MGSKRRGGFIGPPYVRRWTNQDVGHAGAGVEAHASGRPTGQGDAPARYLNFVPVSSALAQL
jgi:hypothetical protein